MRNSVFPDPDALAALCRRHHICKLSLFGSKRTGTDRSESDVVLLVEFDSGCKPGFLGMARIEIELSAMLGGRRVDLRTAEELSEQFRQEVIGTAVEQYGTP